MKLLTTQKNQIFETIESSGLSPNLFEISEITRYSPFEYIVTKVELKDSNFYFLFDNMNKSEIRHKAIYSPGQSDIMEERETYDWYQQIICFNSWIGYLLREIKAINKWERLDEEVKELGIFFNSDNDKFSRQEYEILTHKFILLKEGVSDIGLSVDQNELIQKKLDELLLQANDLNKFDWKSLFIGTIISIVIQLQVTPSNAKLLWDLIKGIFNNFLIS